MTEWGRGGDAPWWAALNQVEGIGAATMMRLARVFGSPEAALRAPREELIARGGLSLPRADGVQQMSQPQSLSVLRAKIDSWAQSGVELIAIGEAAYPCALMALKAPPPLLYIRGRLMPQDTARSLAIVGTREPTHEGEIAAERLARAFAERGFTNVSGLARGIDTAGHKGALSVPSGRTIAVLGSGLLRIYPPENAGLAEDIASRGCLVAEVPPETDVSRRLLLARDRIQAALSRAVIVVQAYRQCGSIVTATHAVACGRLLFGVPWSEGPFAEGWERLQEMGAQPVDPDADLDAIARQILTAGPAPLQHPLPE